MSDAPDSIPVCHVDHASDATEPAATSPERAGRRGVVGTVSETSEEPRPFTATQVDCVLPGEVVPARTASAAVGPRPPDRSADGSGRR